MAFSSDRTSSSNNENTATPPADDLTLPPDILALRRSARHRLIGASLLVLIAVISLPFLLDAPPSTIAPAHTITIDGKADSDSPATRPLSHINI